MHVALFTDGIYPYVVGGMQKHSFYLAKYFARNKMSVDLYHVLTKENETNKLDCFTEEEMKYIHSILIPFPQSGKLPGHYIQESFKYSSAIYKEFKKRDQKIDFVYAQGFCGWQFMINKKRGERSLPKIGVNFHGLEMFQKAAGIKSMMEQLLFKSPVLKNLKNADTVFSLGGRLTDILLKQGIQKEKIISLPIGIDETWIREDVVQHKKITFLFVGRYERRKGIEELLSVIKELIAIDFEFHFIGAIPENMKVIHEKICYWGVLTDIQKIKEIYKLADVLVCPSYSEGMPTVILEAMASGLAIIASNVGAINELVGNENGILLMKPGDKKELKNALLELIKKDPQKLMQMKQCSINKIRNGFLWEAIIQKTINSINATGKSTGDRIIG